MDISQIVHSKHVQGNDPCMHLIVVIQGKFSKGLFLESNSVAMSSDLTAPFT